MRATQRNMLQGPGATTEGSVLFIKVSQTALSKVPDSLLGCRNKYLPPSTDFWGVGLWRSSVSILEVLVSLSKILSSEIKHSIDILKFSFLRSSTSVSEWTAGSGDKFQTFGLLQTDRNKDALSISPANENFLQVSRKQGTKVLT